MKIHKPTATCLLFSSGKIVCTGARSESECRMASSRLVALLRQHGIQANFINFHIENIVTAVYCPFFVHLQTLQSHLQGQCTYDASVFPGLIYRICVPNKVAILCFNTGKCIISGCHNREQSYSVWADFFQSYLLRSQSVYDTRNDLPLLASACCPESEVIDDLHAQYGTNDLLQATFRDKMTSTQELICSLNDISSRLCSHILAASQEVSAQRNTYSYSPK
jgi:TATA-box binding protein (TBP) (component of TFIID and TFIIIB)